MRPGALNGSLTTRRSSAAHPKRASLGTRDTDTGPMLLEERAVLLKRLAQASAATADPGLRGRSRGRNAMMVSSCWGRAEDEEVAQPLSSCLRN